MKSQETKGSVKGFRAVVALLCALSLVAILALAAGCEQGGGGGSTGPSDTGAGFEEFPLGEDITFDGYIDVAGVYFQPVDMEPSGDSLPAAQSDMHIEADIAAAADNELGYGVGDFVPNLTVDYEVTNSSDKVVSEGTFMPMNASDGPHYGANIKIGDPGTYHIKFTIHNPEEQGYLLHTDSETGVEGRFWTSPLIAEWDFEWDGPAW